MKGKHVCDVLKRKLKESDVSPMHLNDNKILQMIVHTKTVIKNTGYEQLKLKSSQDIVSWCLSLIQKVKFPNLEERLISIFW